MTKDATPPIMAMNAIDEITDNFIAFAVVLVVSVGVVLDTEVFWLVVVSFGLGGRHHRHGSWSVGCIFLCAGGWKLKGR